jgi:hypothetical protein
MSHIFLLIYILMLYGIGLRKVPTAKMIKFKFQTFFC